MISDVVSTCTFCHNDCAQNNMAMRGNFYGGGGGGYIVAIAKDLNELSVEFEGLSYRVWRN